MLPLAPACVDHVGVDAIGPGPLEITEEQLAESGPRVRALQVQRLERVWAVVEGHIDEHLDGTRPVDPRMLEIGLRVVREETALYRLSKPMQVAEDEDEDPQQAALDRRALVLMQIEAAEAKLRGEEQGVGGS